MSNEQLVKISVVSTDKFAQGKGLEYTMVIFSTTFGLYWLTFAIYLFDTLLNLCLGLGLWSYHRANGISSHEQI